MIAYLEVQNNGPNQSKNYGRLPFNNIRWVDVHQFNLQEIHKS